MKQEVAMDYFLKELQDAEKKYPEWPRDIIHAAAIVIEEAGELVQATLNYRYNKQKYSKEEFNVYFEKIKKEAIQTGAMALRFLKNFDNVSFWEKYK